MMSKKQWFVVLCIFILYLLLGAAIFHIIEYKEEQDRLQREREEQRTVVDFINDIFKNIKGPDLPPRHVFIKSLENYCRKPFSTPDEEDEKFIWDFYHSLFFVITVVSTIGYGNLAPTTMFTRVFMIFYGLIGIPMNGIVMVTLGNYFGRSFTKLYQRWKTSKTEHDPSRLGLISQIILYLVPGFTFFIFLPSAFMVLFENWDYDVAVYYCFVTLTTIGFGDYVAGVENINGRNLVPYWIYKIFLLIWIIGGLGYVVMILGFITQALQSKKIHEIEQIIRHNIKKTPVRIRQELRNLIEEVLFIKSTKRGFRGEFDYIPSRLERSQSCPDLNIYRNVNSPTMARKRALSECPHNRIFLPMQSSLDLDIDKDSSYQQSEDFIQQSNLLTALYDALSILEDSNDLDNQGYDGFSDSEILASEKSGSKWSLKSQTLSVPHPKTQRRRAISDIRMPSTHKIEACQDVTWYGQEAENNFQQFLQRQRTLSVPSADMEKPQQNFLTRIKNKFISTKEDKGLDVEWNNRRASMFTPAENRYLRQTNRGRASILSVQQQEAVLEQTSVADLIRALSAVTVPETILPTNNSPKRKMGTAGLTPPNSQSPPRTRRLAIRPNLQTRRTSLMPDSHVIQNERRRFSLRPVEENLLAPPPPYSLKPSEESSKPRKFSRTLNVPSISISPVQRQMNKRENKEDQ